MTESNDSYVKWWHLIIVIFSVISVQGGIALFGFYPKYKGEVLETKMEANALILSTKMEINTDFIREMRGDMKEIKQLLNEIKIDNK